MISTLMNALGMATGALRVNVLRWLLTALGGVIHAGEVIDGLGMGADDLYAAFDAAGLKAIDALMHE